MLTLQFVDANARRTTANLITVGVLRLDYTVILIPASANGV